MLCMLFMFLMLFMLFTHALSTVGQQALTFPSCGGGHDATPWLSASSSKCWISIGPLAALSCRQNVSSRS